MFSFNLFTTLHLQVRASADLTFLLKITQVKIIQSLKVRATAELTFLLKNVQSLKVLHLQELIFSKAGKENLINF